MTAHFGHGTAAGSFGEQPACIRQPDHAPAAVLVGGKHWPDCPQQTTRRPPYLRPLPDQPDPEPAA
jgi:hypothetical protein